VSARWERLQELFHAAQRLPPDERAQFLARETADDPALRQEVEQMLVPPTPGDGLLAAIRDDAAGLLDELLPQPGERLGPYRILASLAEGGMGTVFVAARDDEQYEKRVAIKCLAAPLAGPRTAERFRHERQILADLDHPGIAHLLDGGITPKNLPYLVMELVEGTPIDSYCRAAALDLRQRLVLFRRVCEAVAYAHSKLVLHRDLKPQNILVRNDGAPKLLDFGIAKVLTPEGLDAPPGLTRLGERLLTPEYASPEQLRGEPLATASDVYSLGVVLYELLVGERPYELRQRNLAEIERVVRETEPEPPSARMARRRGASARAQQRELAGDLDNIILKALEKDPARRYATVGQLSDDLDRYLAGYPVLARPATLRYRVAKYVRRHRLALGVAAGVGVALLAFGIAMAAAARQAARERDRAAAVSTFLTELFQIADPSEARGNSVTAREVLDRAATRLGADESVAPATRAALLETMGSVYRGLGLPRAAGPLFDRALGLRQELEGPASPAIAHLLDQVASVHQENGDYAAAEEVFRRALALRRSIFGERHLETAKSENNLGLLLYQRGQPKAAEELHLLSLATRRALAGTESDAVGISLNNLALARFARDDVAGAADLNRQALALSRRLHGDDHPGTANDMANLAYVLSELGEFAEAEALHREALAVRRKVLGPDHPELARSLKHLGTLLQKLGRFEEAGAALREGLAIRRRASGERHPLVAVDAMNLGLLALERGELAAAEEILRPTVARLPELFGASHTTTAQGRANLASVLVARGSLDEAERLFAQALTALEQGAGPEHTATARALLQRAALGRARGDLAAARADAERALAIYRKSPRPRDLRLAAALADLAATAEQESKRDEARKLLEQALTIRRPVLPPGHPSLVATEAALARLAANLPPQP